MDPGEETVVGRPLIGTVSKTYSMYPGCGLSHPNHTMSEKGMGPLYSSAIENSTLLTAWEAFIHTFVQMINLRSG